MFTTTIKNKKSIAFINNINSYCQDLNYTPDEHFEEAIYRALLVINSWKAIIWGGEDILNLIYIDFNS